MDVIRHRACYNRSANDAYYLNSTHKLIRHKIVLSVGVDGCSLRVLWLKYSNNNRRNTLCNLFKEALTKTLPPSKLEVIMDPRID